MAQHKTESTLKHKQNGLVEFGLSLAKINYVKW